MDHGRATHAFDVFSARRMARTIAAVALWATTPAAARSPQEIFEVAAPSIVIVEALDELGSVEAMGSGVVVASGEVVTNCHVAKAARQLRVKYHAAHHDAEIHFADRKRDLCQLSVPDLNAPPAKRSPLRNLKPGARVVAIGAPEGLELTISEGLISAIRQMGDDSGIIQTSAPISPGSSGGGLFDDSGILIGITTFYLAQGQNLNFALPATWIEELQQSGLTGKGLGDPDVKLALADLRDLAELLRKTDSNYDKKLPQLQAALNRMIASSVPPAEWRAGVEVAYATAQSLERASEFQARGDWTGLLAFGEQWSQENPNCEFAWYVIGKAHEGLSEDENTRALQFLRKAQSEQDSSHSTRLGDMGQLHIDEEARQTENAASAYRKALQINPKFARAWYSLGYQYLYQKNRDGARSAYEVLKELDPESAKKLGAEIALH